MRVILVEDQALLREGLAGLFRDAGHDVVASLGDCGDLEGAVREDAPDVVILDADIEDANRRVLAVLLHLGLTPAPTREEIQDRRT